MAPLLVSCLSAGFLFSGIAGAQAAGTSTKPFRGVSVVAPSANTSSLKAAQLSGPCAKSGDTVAKPSADELLTCVPYTNLGALKGSNIELRWSVLYTDKNAVHKIVGDSLIAYDRTFGNKSDQQMYEAKITTNLEFDAFVNLLVTMSKQSFPGFADLISTDSSLRDVVTPWATQLADARSLPSETFNQPGEGFLFALGTASTPVSQKGFDVLFQKSESLRAYADTVDRDYWLNFSNPTQTQISQRFVFIDSLLTLPEAEAKAAYLKKIQTNAKNIYPKFASAVDKGQTIDQIMAPWVSHFVSQLELYKGSVNPIQEHTLIQAAITPPASIADFDVIISRDPRWAATSKAKAAAIGKASY